MGVFFRQVAVAFVVSISPQEVPNMVPTDPVSVSISFASQFDYPQLGIISLNPEPQIPDSCGPPGALCTAVQT